jgi:hypothetical protein
VTAYDTLVYLRHLRNVVGKLTAMVAEADGRVDGDLDLHRTGNAVKRAVHQLNNEGARLALAGARRPRATVARRG